MAMKKSELRELYLMMFPEYPDIVNITQLQSMLGISRHLAYDLINDGYIRGLKIGNAFRIPKVNVIEYVSWIREKVRFELCFDDHIFEYLPPTE